MTFDELNRYILSLKLSERGASTGFIHRMTSLSKRKIAEFNKHASRTKYSQDWYLKDMRRIYCGKYFNDIYYQHKPAKFDDKQHECRYLIEVYDVFDQIIQDHEYTIERAEMLVKYLYTGILSQNKCRTCKNDFMTMNLSIETTCPTCKLYERFICEKCDVILPVDCYTVSGVHLCHQCSKDKRNFKNMKGQVKFITG